MENSHDAPTCIFQHDFRMHPGVMIYIWVCLAVSAQMLSERLIIALFAVLILLSLKLSRARLVQLLRKMKWIFLSMFVIYAYVTPGEPLWLQLGSFSPINEGVLQGLMQLARLIIVLAGLAMLLAVLTQAQLLAGLYFCMRPLDLLGISRQRMAKRLALTLRYADQAMHDAADSWYNNVERIFAPVSHTPEFIELEVMDLTRLDYLIVALTTVALVGAWL
jgi:energy-coupling factor transport system permease protein